MDNNTSDMTAMMDQLGLSDPKMKMFFQMMNQQKDHVDEDISELEQLQKKYDSLLQRYRTLKERDYVLAAALGACPKCWGDNVRCRECKGDGVPGYFLPVKSAFTEYVHPVLETVRMYQKHKNSENKKEERATARSE